MKLAVQEAETRKQGPVYVIDIYKILQPARGIMDPSKGLRYPELQRILQDLYREDAILADKELNRYSLEARQQDSSIRRTPFTLCSDHMETNFPGY